MAAELHPATIWEAVADRLGGVDAIVQGDTRRTWTDFEANAAHIAGGLQEAGVGPGSKVAVYMHNRPEFLEVFFAAFKLRAQPVNVNYRYRGAELAYLLDNSDAEALIFDASLADKVAAADHRVPCLIQVPDVEADLVPGARLWADALQVPPAARCDRDEADHHILYTGGTTGLPKGVLYELGGLVRELLTLGAPVAGAAAPNDIADVVRAAAAARAEDRAITTLVLPPLMHGTGMALAMVTLLWGGVALLSEPGPFDADAALTAIDEHDATVLSLVGDAFARPLVEALDGNAQVDISSLRVIMSSGAMLSSTIKAALLTRAPQAMVIDTLAASEAPMGSSISVAGAAAETARFSLRPGTVVFDEHDEPVLPGSGVVGRVGVASTNPVGYYKDPEKTAATFRVIGGNRYAFPGDWARVDDDGSIVLLGRGSHCINSGGEKVFPEEVEESLKTHPAVIDALVFGVDDDRWGQRIEAVVALAGPADGPSLTEHVRNGLAAYKAPKAVHVVDEVPRAPNGKADYDAARRLAQAAVT